MPFDPQKIAADLKWLQDHPWFNEKPATIREFLTEDYLNIEKGVRPGVKQELVALFGEEVNPKRIAKFRWGMFTGAIGIGKTTMASIILPYMVHWVLCLKDPQEYFDLLPGSRIAFMMMSTSEEQAKETLFGDVKARIKHSPWFAANWPWDPNLKNQLRFEKDIWIIPGSSSETSFEGYNILGGILDEADSHKVTKEKDYADDGWNTINSRIDSRFQDRGFLLTIGQMKKSNGFAASKYNELVEDKQNAHTVRMTIWESLGWEKFADPATGITEKFWYDTKRKEIVDEAVPRLIGYPDHILQIPKVYEKNFKNKPEKALRDLAGIPPLAGSTFISLVYRIEEAFERWTENHGEESPVSTDSTRPILAPWFRNPTPLRRAGHLDIGYSDEGDAAGIVLGHVSHLVDTEEELDKPYIVIDCMIRLKAPPGHEIFLADLRSYFYELKARGFKIREITMDGFQSVETRQQLRKNRMNATYLSVDKSKLPYEDLREAIYEGRIEIPPYMTYINPGDGEMVNIAFKELSELEDDGKKVDHPLHGSKDVADGLAGVVTTLMGDRGYRRNVRSKDREPTDSGPFEVPRDSDLDFFGNHSLPIGFGGSGLKAPVPPSTGGMPSFPIPHGLRGRGAFQ